jgi:hypothetical protein
VKKSAKKNFHGVFRNLSGPVEFFFGLTRSHLEEGKRTSQSKYPRDQASLLNDHLKKNKGRKMC